MPSFRPIHPKLLTLGLCSLLLGARAFAAEPNTLTAAEKSAGWKLLFAGKSFAAGAATRRRPSARGGR